MRKATLVSLGTAAAHLNIRRTISLIVLWAFVGMGATTGVPSTHAVAQSRDEPARYMRRVSKELIAAHRALSQAKMTRVIRSRGDVAAIGQFSLGTYFVKLPRASRSRYYNGMTRFMARYVIAQSKTYRVASAQIVGPSKRQGRDYVVNSRINLTNGSVYDVQWHLVRRGKTFKIRDVQVLGFWVLPFQRNLFRSYVRKANGNVNALVLALNQ